MNEYFNITLSSIPESAAVQLSIAIAEVKNEWIYSSTV
jgi:hypothetical protein